MNFVMIGNYIVHLIATFVLIFASVFHLTTITVYALYLCTYVKFTNFNLEYHKHNLIKE